MTPSVMWLVLALVFSLSFPILGIIFAAVVLRRYKECSRPGLVKGLAILAIVIAIGRLLYWIAAAAVVGIAGFWAY